MNHPEAWFPDLESAQLADVEVMDRLEQEAFNTPWSRELLRGAILNPDYTVRVTRLPTQEVLGFYIAHPDQERFNLDNLVVAPEHRNQGLGTALIQDWAEQGLDRGLSRLTLQVNTDNVAAQRLYKRLGFASARLLVSYYPNGDDAYYMIRPTQLGDDGLRARRHLQAWVERAQDKSRR